MCSIHRFILELEPPTSLPVHLPSELDTNPDVSPDMARARRERRGRGRGLPGQRHRWGTTALAKGVAQGAAFLARRQRWGCCHPRQRHDNG